MINLGEYNFMQNINLGDQFKDGCSYTILLLLLLLLHCVQKKHPLVFSFITSSQINQFA